ncbi:hypothetical protein J6590_047543 [Homalodisca vitripennis]|nr:hypothetical protein J6590_047543 [Homalodisca vitripennis]
MERYEIAYLLNALLYDYSAFSPFARQLLKTTKRNGAVVYQSQEWGYITDLMDICNAVKVGRHWLLCGLWYNRVKQRTKYTVYCTGSLCSIMSTRHIQVYSNVQQYETTMRRLPSCWGRSRRERKPKGPTFIILCGCLYVVVVIT